MPEYSYLILYDFCFILSCIYDAFTFIMYALENIDDSNCFCNTHFEKISLKSYMELNALKLLFSPFL